MEFYTFSKDAGRKIEAFQSDFVMTRIIRTVQDAHIGCMYLGQNGIIGYHQATMPQLLLILNGGGHVRGEKEAYIEVRPGDAVFWEKGEWHETKSEQGLTAIVIESNELQPSKFMKLKD